MSACHCSPCGRDFTSLTNFDKHQDWDYRRRPMLICLDPGELGMELDRFGRWRSGSDSDSRPPHWNLRAEQAPPSVIGSKP